jgi:predicted transposase/invertase (TIGR01784 family)
MDFTFADGSVDRYHRTVQLVERETGVLFYHKLRFVYIELPRFLKEESELQDDEDRWIWALCNMGNFESSKIVQLGEKEIEDMALNIKDEAAFNDELAWARNRGLEEGRAEGRAEGRNELNLEHARSMKTKGLAPEIIAEITGLSVEQIHKI